MFHCECGSHFHACKQPDHMLICPRKLVPCINSVYGCDRRLPRHQLANHLAVCPASIVQCPLMIFPEFVYSSNSVSCPDGDGFCRSNFDSAVCLSLMLRERQKDLGKKKSGDKKGSDRAGSEPLNQLLSYQSQGLGDTDNHDCPSEAVKQDEKLPSSGLSARIISCLESSPPLQAPHLPQLVNHNLAFVNPSDGCPRAHDWRPRGARVCSQIVRRDEFTWHAAQHQRLLPNLSGSDTLTAETVCPLAYLGCTARFTGDTSLVFDLFGHAFARRNSSSIEVSNATNETDIMDEEEKLENSNSNYPSLMQLPDELIDRILSYLDSHALLCLRLTCRAMRHRLDDDHWRRGRRCCVEIDWQLRINQSPTGITGWRQVSSPGQARWFVSGQAALSQHRPGGLAASVWLSRHLLSCPFYERSEAQSSSAPVRVLPSSNGAFSEI